MCQTFSNGLRRSLAARRVDEFTALLGRPETTAAYNHVIFDTEPTGHTLRLFKLPAAWTGFIDTNSTGTSCLGPLSGLQAQVEQYRASLAALADSATTTVVLVSRPDPAALTEAARTHGELADLGVTQQRLSSTASSTRLIGMIQSGVRSKRGREALQSLSGRLATLPRIDVPLLAWAPMHVDTLRRVFATTPAPIGQMPQLHARDVLPRPLAGLVDEIVSSSSDSSSRYAFVASDSG